MAVSQKNRKFGRNRDRSPAMKRYRNEERWTKNAERRRRREEKRRERAARKREARS